MSWTSAAVGLLGIIKNYDIFFLFTFLNIRIILYYTNPI